MFSVCMGLTKKASAVVQTLTAKQHINIRWLATGNTRHIGQRISWK